LTRDDSGGRDVLRCRVRGHGHHPQPDTGHAQGTDGLLSTGAAWGVWLLYLVVVAVVPLLVVTRRDTNWPCRTGPN
jgi:hypothetical protein